MPFCAATQSPVLSFATKCLKISGTSIPTKKRWSRHMSMSPRGWENLLADGLVMVTQFLNRPNASLACKGATMQSPSRWGRQVSPQVPYIHSPGRMFSGGQIHWVRKDSAEDTDNVGGDPTLSELRAGLLPWACLTGIFCTKSSIKRSETKPVRLRPGRPFRGPGAHGSGKNEIHCYSSTISPDLLGTDRANWFDETVINLSDEGSHLLPLIWEASASHSEKKYGYPGGIHFRFTRFSGFPLRHWGLSCSADKSFQF